MLEFLKNPTFLLPPTCNWIDVALLIGSPEDIPSAIDIPTFLLPLTLITPLEPVNVVWS